MQNVPFYKFIYNKIKMPYLRQLYQILKANFESSLIFVASFIINFCVVGKNLY